MKDKNTKKRKVIRDGELDLAGFKLPCFVLEDGTRVLSGRGMQDALKIVGEVEKGKEKPGGRLKEFLAQKLFEPFIYKGKEPVDERSSNFNPIICYIGGTKIHGYEATLLVDICNIFLKARKEAKEKGKSLTTRQKIVFDQSEVLLGAFAKVGIIALIDEATGYQYERERFELQKILKAYISKEILKWQETFQLSFYKEIFRLWSIPFTAENIKRKPSFIGILTNKLIYENLPKGTIILENLKEKTPKTKGGHYRYRFHQSLTKKIGKEALKKVIHTVEAYALISKDKNKFLRLVKERYHPERDLPYIDVDAMEDEKETKFDKALEALSKVPKVEKARNK